MRSTRFYAIFNNIKYRTGHRNDPYYKVRGIKCLWGSFEEFKTDMYADYLAHVAVFGENRTQIDRIDTNGHYSKENCRWVTPTLNSSNRRNNVIVYFQGNKMTLKQAAEVAGMDYKLVHNRLYKLHWPFDKAIQK